MQALPNSHFQRRRLCLGMALAGTSLAALPVRADLSWPRHLVRVVASGPPGSYSDNIARPLVDYLSQRLDRPFIVDNRAGVNSSTGVGEVARAQPDGHTLVITNSSSLTINPQLYRKLSYTPEQLAPITPVLEGHFVLSVNRQWAKAQQIATAADLVRWGKNHPGQLRYASAGVGNLAHLTFAMLSTREGLNALHVPYRGQSAAQLGLLAGEVEVMFDISSHTAPHHAGKTRALAVTSSRRLSRLPHLPTMAEAGLPGYDVSYWMGFLTTAGTPTATVERIQAVIAEAVRQPKIRDALALQGEIHTEMPDEFSARIQQEIARWGEIIRREKITAD